MTTISTPSAAADTPPARTPAELLFPSLEQELAATRRLLERFPAEHADWRPHEKSMPLGRLAAHVAELPNFAETMLSTDELDFATRQYTPTVARSADELVAIHDESAASVRAALAGVTYAKLDESWTLRMGDRVFLQERRGTLLLQTLIGHIAHHRGQLTVYYRLLDVPVPALYGPTADER